VIVDDNRCLVLYMRWIIMFMSFIQCMSNEELQCVCCT
jgi:hypothetical protein